ncbi:cytochrome P450, partial [bacterium AH-315-K03]|nr:cytochrome P450 [bacterium AH-315-K03]
MIDLLTDENLIDPYPAYNKIREDTPVCELIPGGIWLVSRYDDVRKGMSDYELFSSTRKAEIYSPSWMDKEFKTDFYIACKEPPEHHKLRSAIDAPFTKQAVRSLLPLMHDTASTLVDKLKPGSSLEFLRDFAYPFVGTIIGNITGLGSIQSLSEIHRWININELASTPDLDKKTIDRIKPILQNQKLLFKKAVEDTRLIKKPLQDRTFFERLVFSEIEGTPLTVEQLINIIELMIRAGFQTTVHLLATAITQLTTNPALLDKLINNTDLIPSFVEELLRLHSTAPFMVRHTTRDYVLQNTLIPKNATVWFSLAAANRDPRAFNNPNDYILNRQNSQHIAFGTGPHICLG